MVVSLNFLEYLVKLGTYAFQLLFCSFSISKFDFVKTQNETKVKITGKICKVSYYTIGVICTWYLETWHVWQNVSHINIMSVVHLGFA